MKRYPDDASETFGERNTMSAKITTSRQPPRSMFLLRRAADAAGYSVAGSPVDEPARGAAPAPALVVASLLCLVGIAFAIY